MEKSVRDKRNIPKFYLNIIDVDGKCRSIFEFNPLRDFAASAKFGRRKSAADGAKEGAGEFANFRERFQNLFSLISLMPRAHGRTSAHGTKLAVLCKFDTAKYPPEPK